MSGFYITNAPVSNEQLTEKYKFLHTRGINVSTIDIETPFPLHIAISSAKETGITVPVLFDGTIYNKGDLLENGNVLSNEVVLYALYKKYGESTAKYLNGGFSFIVYDSEQKIIYGARDRLGEKPFFYRHTNDTLECSSSLKAICSGNKFTINENAKNMYMRFGWIYDSECIFNEVKKLPAGHYFIYNLETKRIRIEKYWDIKKEYHREYPKLDRTGTLKYLDELIEDSIRIRIPKDEYCGMGISSGTDSFSIFNYLRNLCVDIPLYSVVPKFSTKCYNEYPLALEHVKAVDPEKDIVATFLTDTECIEGLSTYTNIYDEPNSDFSCIITNKLFQKMRIHGNARIAFSGIGADDFLFGKPIYGRFFNHIKNYILTSSVLGRYNPNICSNDFSEILDPSDRMSLQRYNTKTYLPNLLVKEDVASQYNGIEVRSPFCDYRLVEFTDSVDLGILFYGNTYKYLLKQIALDKFGINFFNSAKRGFAPEIVELFKIRPIVETIKDTLSTDNVQRYFPEIPYSAVTESFKYMSVTSAQCLLNLYMYIKVMLNYDNDIFK